MVKKNVSLAHDDDALEEMLEPTDANRANRPHKAVFTIIKLEGRERGFWLRLGTAVVNRDESLTVFLNAMPTNGQLHIRDISPRDNNT